VGESRRRRHKGNEKNSLGEKKNRWERPRWELSEGKTGRGGGKCKGAEKYRKGNQAERSSARKGAQQTRRNTGFGSAMRHKKTT